MTEYIKKSEAIKAIVEHPSNIGVFTGKAIKAIETLPAEDVAPKSEVNKLEYTLLGVMHSVDKWLEGEELEQDEVNRAATMREKTLRIIETLKDEIARKIFEEIGQIIDNNTYKSYLPNSSLWCKEYRSNQIIMELAELKKEYI